MADAAVRVDAATGVEERLEHVPGPGGMLYSWIARPPRTDSCVLICTSVFGDFAANYHRERLLGRALAARGVGVVRFHYSGEGNSQGDRFKMTFSSLCDDANTILEHARSLGFGNFAVVGTRLGALVAATTVAATSFPLALLEPHLDPLRLVTDAHRARRISQVAQSVKERESWQQELQRNGVIDLLGYDAYQPLIDSLRGIDLLSVLGSLPRQVFIARFSKSAVDDPIAASLTERGFSVTSRAFDVSESWWFQTERAPEIGDLVPVTTGWLSSALSGSK